MNTRNLYQFHSLPCFSHLNSNLFAVIRYSFNGIPFAERFFMQQNTLLKKLVGLEPGDHPFISMYINTESNANGKFDFDVVVKNLVREHSGLFEEGTAEKESFESDVKLITDQLEKVDTTTKGLAVFACSGSGVFETAEFHVPFEENNLFVLDKPHIYPLVRLFDQNPAYAVVLADTNAAHIYVFRRGRTIENEEIQGTKTNRSEVGGWSQARYQRTIENFHKQHAKEVIEELEKIVRDDKIDQIILSGDENVIIPLLRAEMTKELEKNVVGVLPLNVNTPEHELFEAAEQAIRQNDTLADKEKIDNLFEQNYDDGIGVVGIGKTLTALLNGQVQELYLSADVEEITYNTGEIRKIFKDYAPGEDGDLPNPKSHMLLIDELLKRAYESAEEIRFIENANLLKDAGGVGAILRYQVQAVTN